ncbi:MAG TPA: VOC family protein [Anaeromyxobacteraceae bacterium]|nr:VOC family protein [Anaeromyxobacteraceae bacterium]
MESTRRGLFVWYEHLTKDVKAAIAFYSEVIGWKTQPFDDNYLMWVGSQGPLGGVMKLPDEVAKAGVPPHWMAHVQVENVDDTAALARKLGAKICHEPTDIPTVGRFAVITDPQGAPISVFKPNMAMTLHDGSKDGEFCWNELLTSDSAAAIKFYSEIFGWKILEEMDMGAMGTYRVFGLGEKRLGGMMTLPKGAPTPPMWVFYASTSDLDAAIERAAKKGGKVMNGPMEVPGGGRIAQLADAQGAAFALHQAPKK